MKPCLSLLAVGAILIVPATAPAAGRVGGAAPAQSLTMQPPLSPFQPAPAMTPAATTAPAAGRVGGAAPAQSLTMQPPLSPFQPAPAVRPAATRGPTSTGQPHQP